MSPSFLLPLLPSLLPGKQHGDRQGPDAPGGKACAPSVPGGYGAGP